MQGSNVEDALFDALPPSTSLEGLRFGTRGDVQAANYLPLRDEFLSVCFEDRVGGRSMFGADPLQRLYCQICCGLKGGSDRKYTCSHIDNLRTLRDEKPELMAVQLEGRCFKDERELEGELLPCADLC